jgi:putative sterol carrier protein
MGEAAGDGAEAMVGWLHERFRPEAAAGMAAVIEIELTGPAGGRLSIQVEDGRLKTSLGGDAAPDVRLVASTQDWSDVLDGRANAEMLVVEDRIRIEGNQGLAMKLRSLFRRAG